VILNEQREKDWDKRYLDRDHPWEEEQPSYKLLEVIRRYAKNEISILEIGCGLGTNAIWLAKEGFMVDAVDISAECIRLARQRVKEEKPRVNFITADFCSEKLQKSYDLIFDRGCFHSFKTQEGLNFFAARVAEHLREDGFWLTLSGNADNPDDIEKRRNNQYPRISLRALSEAVEPHFEILEVMRKRFGEKNNFLAWQGMFQKRRFFY
jgi:cyclopropane fatty-acyl-phospholipid synthase-like methyltransferase